VTESRGASEKETKRVRRTNRRLRGLVVGVAVLLAVAVAGGIFAVIQRSEARDAETAQLAQRLGAQALVEEDLDLSLLLARQAVAIDDSPQTRGYLLADLQRADPVVRILNGKKDGSDPGLGRAIAVSPGGTTLAIGAFAGLFLYDARTLEQIGKPLPGVADNLGPVAYSPDGKRLAVGVGLTITGGGSLRLLDARTRKQLARVSLGGAEPTHVAFTKDGSQLAVVETVHEGGSWITMRDAATLRQIGSRIEPRGFTGRWLSGWWIDPGIALTPDSRSIVTASTVGELTWWDLESHEKTRTLEIPEGYRALALSADGRTAAIGLDDGIQLLDVPTGTARESRGTLASNPIWLLFSPNGEIIVSTSRDSTVTLVDTRSLTPRETLRGHSDSVWQPVFSPDGKTLYTASADGTTIVWDVGRERRFGRPFTYERDREGLTVNPGKFSVDGRVIAVGLNDRGIRLWDASRLTPVGRPMLETGGEVADLGFSAEGRTLAAVTENGLATIWDLESQSLRTGPFRVDQESAGGVSISADGTMLATAGRSGVKLWDVATGSVLGRIGDRRAAGDVAFSPAESLVAFVREGFQQTGGGEVEIWDVSRRSRVTKLLIVDDPWAIGWAIAFSPDGRLLAASGLDSLVHLWDVRTGKLLRELEQNVGNAVHALAFTPDSSTIAISGSDGFASLWDVATGAKIGPRLGVGSREAKLDLSSDGSRLLMTNGDGKGAVWDVDPELWAQRACTLANRTLTRDEWEEFLAGRPYEPACAT